MSDDQQTKPGFIVAICGGPGTGKSSLVRKLVDHYQAIPIFEGEEMDFPERIKDNLKNDINHLESRLYFRNLLVRMHLEAIKHKEAGKLVIMDTFWLTNLVYVETWLEEGLAKDLMREIYELDHKFLIMPDLMIILQASRERVKDFMIRRGRSFETSENIINRFIKAGEAHHEFFKNHDNVMFVDRSDLDFSNQDHFSKITEIIDNKILS